MNKALWSKKLLAVPACTALVIGGITLTATQANADPADLHVTSQSVSGRVLTINGTGTAGDNIQLDEAFNATRHEIGSDGKWTITYTIPGTDTDSHTYTIEQLNGLNQDGETTVTAAAEPTAQPFAITNHSVSGRTVTVSGTGKAGDTVNVEQGFPVTRHAIGDDGTWSFTFEIPGTDTDSHTYTIDEQNSGFATEDQGTVTVAAEATEQPFAITDHSVSGRTVTVSGTGKAGDTVQVDQGYPVVRHTIADDGTWSFTFEIPGTDTDEHTYNIYEEAANLSIEAQGTVTVAAESGTTDPASQFSLTSPEDGSTVDSRTVTYTGTGTPGDLVNVLDADGNRAAPQVLVGDDGNWTTTGTFSDSAAQVQHLSVNQIGGGQGQGNITFTITLPAVATNPGDGGNGGTGNGGTGTGTGTGTSTGTGAGTSAGTPSDPSALPVVSG